MKRLDQFDFTRLIAALVVVFFHTGRSIFPFNVFPFNPIFISGASAVGYFFLLSGFVITLSYYRPGEKFDFKRYWMARFSRIFPLYLVSFFLTCLYFMDATIHASVSEYLSVLFLLQAWVPQYALTFNFPAWAMSAEVFFYLAFPFLAIWMARSKLSVRAWVWGSLIFWALNQLFLFWMGSRLPDTTVANNLMRYFPLSHFSIFVMGVAAGLWYVRLGQHQPSDQRTTRWLFLLGLVLLSTMLLNKGSGGVPATKNMLAPFALLILLALAMETSILARLFTRSWMTRLSEASYSMFVLHMPIRWIYSSIMESVGIKISPNLDYWIYIAVLIAFSLLAHDWIEYPARNWLLKNPKKLWLILGDASLLVGGLFVSYLARIGMNISDYSSSLNFSLRIGIPVYLLLLILFRSYSPIPFGNLFSWVKRSLLPVALIGTAALTGLLVIAQDVGWINTFPRSMPAIYMAVLSTLLLIFRYFLQRSKSESIAYEKSYTD